MIQNILMWFMLLAVAVGLAWVAIRLWRARNPLVKWGGVFVSGLLALVVLSLSVIALNGMFKAYSRVTKAAPDLKVAGTPEQILAWRAYRRYFFRELPLTNQPPAADWRQKSRRRFPD